MQLAGIRSTFSEQALRDAAGCFDKIVLWGLLGEAAGTHRHVFRAYYDVCQRVGLKAVWMPDWAPCDQISPQDIVFVHSSSQNIPGVLARKPVIVDFHMDVNRDAVGDGLYAQVRDYERRITELELPYFCKDGNFEQWDPVTWYERERRILCQPWGSDLMEHEFMPPADCFYSGKVFWIGSWWKAVPWGNFDEIAALAKWTKKNGLRLSMMENCDGPRNAFFVRASRVAPAIAGAEQARTSLLACRTFKNISYGQFCVSNVPKVNELLDGSAIFDADIPALLDKAMAVTPARAAELTRFHQSKIRNYNVAAHLYLILATAIVSLGK